MTLENTKITNDSAPRTGEAVFFAMTDIMRYSAKAKNANFPLTEMFFDPNEGVLRYVALDVGGWFERREVIVAERLMGEPDNSNRVWPAEISPEAIKNAPEWTDPKSMEKMPISAMPSLMVGPLGGHFASITVSADLKRLKAVETEGNLKVEPFARLSDWVGLPVIGQSREVGTLIDFLFDPDTNRLTHLVIDTGGMLAAQQVVVPYDLLTGLGENGAHANVNVTQKLLQEAPPLEHFDEINRSWIDSLRSYYQLAPRL